jgi:hypothetical protein
LLALYVGAVSRAVPVLRVVGLAKRDDPVSDIAVIREISKVHRNRGAPSGVLFASGREAARD